MGCCRAQFCNISVTTPECLVDQSVGRRDTIPSQEAATLVPVVLLVVPVVVLVAVGVLLVVTLLLVLLLGADVAV